MISQSTKTTTQNSRVNHTAQPVALAFGQQNSIMEKFKPAEPPPEPRFEAARSTQPLGVRDHMVPHKFASHAMNQDASQNAIRPKPLGGSILTSVDPSVSAAEAEAAARFFIESQKSELENHAKGSVGTSERTMSNLNSSDHLFVANLQAVSLEKLVKSKLEVLFQQQRDANIELSGLYDIVLEQVEKPLIELALQSRNGNQVKTAQLLGINRNTLKKKIDSYKIKVRRSSQKED